jgi:alkaline phosphatase
VKVRAGIVGVCLAFSVSAFGGPIRNVILCIGDGMGPGQVASAHCYLGGPLVFETFPHQTRVTTLSAGGDITDSAAAATALATGYKASDGVVSLALPGDGSERETVLEVFAKRGKSTGLVTTSYLTDATPAGFGAHATVRSDYGTIANDYLTRTKPNVLFGGGGAGLDIGTAQAAGYRVATNTASLLALTSAREDHVAAFLGAGPMPYVYDGLGDFPTLSQMAGVALARLSRDPDGFFLMIEGGRIDHACHANDIDRCVPETVAFNEAVRGVCAWASNRVDTLVIVTADHETGGLTVAADNGAGVLPEVTWSTGGHTATPVAVYAFGVNAELVEAATDNTQLCGVMRSAAFMPATDVKLTYASGGHVQNTWAVSSGDVYRVESSTSLSPPVWQPCLITTASCERLSFDMPTVGNQGFFRVITERP